MGEHDVTDASGFNVEARPLCPFCSKTFGDEMIDAYYGASMSCSTCGPEPYGHIDITCDGCGRLVYRKEYG
jgi:hypothetical protein